MLDKQSKITRVENFFKEYVQPGQLSFKDRAAINMKKMQEQEAKEKREKDIANGIVDFDLPPLGSTIGSTVEINPMYETSKSIKVNNRKKETTALPTRIPNYMKPNAAAMQKLGLESAEAQKARMDLDWERKLEAMKQPKTPCAFGNTMKSGRGLLNKTNTKKMRNAY